MQGQVEIDPVDLQFAPDENGGLHASGSREMTVRHRGTGLVRVYNTKRWRPEIVAAFASGAVMRERDFLRYIQSERGRSAVRRFYPRTVKTGGR